MAILEQKLALKSPYERTEEDEQRDRCLEYLHKLFDSQNNRILLERINIAFKAMKYLEKLKAIE
jgi:hypothetical protein